MTQEGEAQREPPDPEELRAARENALNPSHHNKSVTKSDARAQVLQMQQLNHDIYRLSESMDDLNDQLETYSERSRKLTLALIALGILQFTVAAVAAYLRFF